MSAIATGCSEGWKKFAYEQIWLFIICIIVALVVEFALLCFKDFARKYPRNYIALFIFTLCESYIVACVCAFSKPGLVLLAAGITLAIVVSLTFYACLVILIIQTKTDFTTKYGIIICICIVILFLLIFSWFVQSNAYQIIITGIIILLFGIFIVYDTQLVAKKGKYSLSYDDYILGALFLYIDIITMFLYILKFLQKT